MKHVLITFDFRFVLANSQQKQNVVEGAEPIPSKPLKFVKKGIFCCVFFDFKIVNLKNGNYLSLKQ